MKKKKAKSLGKKAMKRTKGGLSLSPYTPLLAAVSPGLKNK
jgi:hypothetical protein